LVPGVLVQVHVDVVVVAPSTLLVVLAVGLELARLVRKEFLLTVVVLLRELGRQRWVIR